MTLYIHPRDERAAHTIGARYSVMAINREIGAGRTPLAAVRKAHAHLREVAREAERLMAPLFAAMRTQK